MTIGEWKPTPRRIDAAVRRRCREISGRRGPSHDRGLRSRPDRRQFGGDTTAARGQRNIGSDDNCSWLPWTRSA